MDVMMLSTGFEAGNGNAIIKPTMRLLYISFMVRQAPQFMRLKQKACCTSDSGAPPERKPPARFEAYGADMHNSFCLVLHYHRPS